MGLNHFLIERESVQSVGCFMVQIAHFHSHFKNDLEPLADGVFIILSSRITIEVTE